MDNKKRNIVLFVVSVLIIITLVASSIIYFSPKQTDYNSLLFSQKGVHDGDYFIYSVLGSYNGSLVNGSFKIEFPDNSFWQSRDFNTSNPELNERLNNSAIQFITFYFDMGTCKFSTPFGIKNVVWTFGFIPGPEGIDLASVSFFGIDPNVVYGYRINGPGLHLDLVLNQTNNADAMSGNTNPFAWAIPNYIESSYQANPGVVSANRGSIKGWWIWTDGAIMNFNITGGNIRLYGFSEGDMCSMMEGGPFAYNYALSRMNSTNVAGEAQIPQGIFLINICGLSREDGRFEYTLT